MKINKEYILIALCLLFIAYTSRIDCNKHDPSIELLKIEARQDSLAESLRTFESITQLQIDSTYAILKSIATQKAHTEAKQLTLKKRIEDIEKQRSEYLKNANK